MNYVKTGLILIFLNLVTILILFNKLDTEIIKFSLYACLGMLPIIYYENLKESIK